MQQPIDPGYGYGPLTDPVGITWLSRFAVCLREECRNALGDEWETDIDVRLQVVRVRRIKDGAELVAALHPGMHVVTPQWAAHRVACQLQLDAVSRKMIPPPHGSASSSEVF